MAMHQMEAHPPRPHRLTVDNYFRMAEVGILGPDDRVELIDGEIIDMPPPGQLHAGTVNQLAHELFRAVNGRAILHTQNPVVLGRYSAPQPDIALLRPRVDYYKSALPRPADMLLAIEVADSSLSYDRGVKVALYGRHGVPELWVVDVRGKVLTRYQGPHSDGYMRVDEPDLAQPLVLGPPLDANVDLASLFAD